MAPARFATVDDRGEAVPRSIDAVAERAQGLDEGRLRPFAHAIRAHDAIHPRPERDERGEEARGGAGVADEQFERRGSRPAAGDFAADALDATVARREDLADPDDDEELRQ